VTPPDFGRDFVKPEELTKGHVYAFVINSNFRTNFQPVQQDDMLFRYCLTTHKGQWKQGHCRDFGWSAANPLIGVPRLREDKLAPAKAGGTLERTMSFCRIDKPNVFLLTLKHAEDGPRLRGDKLAPAEAGGIIVRLIETEGQEVTATMTLPHLTIKKAWRTNLVEENQAELNHTEHSVDVPVKAFGISTIRIKFGN